MFDHWNGVDGLVGISGLQGKAEHQAKSELRRSSGRTIPGLRLLVSTTPVGNLSVYRTTFTVVFFDSRLGGTYYDMELTWRGPDPF